MWNMSHIQLLVFVMIQDHKTGKHCSLWAAPFDRGRCFILSVTSPQHQPDWFTTIKHQCYYVKIQQDEFCWHTACLRILLVLQLDCKLCRINISDITCVVALKLHTTPIAKWLQREASTSWCTSITTPQCTIFVWKNNHRRAQTDRRTRANNLCWALSPAGFYPQPIDICNISTRILLGN